jgi:hypothetical protein
LENFWLRAVISLPTETFALVGTTCKTSILIIQKPFEGIALKGKDYSVFMAVVKSVGWDSRGRQTKNELPEVVAEFRNMYPFGLGPDIPLVLTDAETLDNIIEMCAQASGQGPHVEEHIEAAQIVKPLVEVLPQTTVVDIGKYRDKKKRGECPQMAFDFDIVNG